MKNKSKTTGIRGCPALPAKTRDSAPSKNTAIRGSTLINLVTPMVEVFRTPDLEVYSTFKVNGHRETHPVSSKGFRSFMQYEHFCANQTSPRPQLVQDAVQHFEALGRFGSCTEQVFVRCAGSGEVNYLDLANDTWGAIEFANSGWEFVQKHKVRFRRLPGMLPLPIPERGGDLNDLREMLNLSDDESWVLFVSDLIAAILPRGPYPVLVVLGQPGSAKTTTTRVFRKMVDPNVSPARSMPKDERDLMIMAKNGWALCFDNLSFIPAWFSDALCRVSGGGGLSTRGLYTNDEEVIFQGMRPVVINGIEELANRSDLLARTVLVELPVITKYQDEAKFWQRFETMHPRLLGALLDIAVDALNRLSEARPMPNMRMVHFAKLGIATEQALGQRKGVFLEAYSRNLQNANKIALEASVITPAIRSIAERGFEGTATELLAQLDNNCDEELRRRKSWPKIPKTLSAMLRRLAQPLEGDGVLVNFDRANSPDRTRTITIQRARSGKQRNKLLGCD